MLREINSNEVKLYNKNFHLAVSIVNSTNASAAACWKLQIPKTKFRLQIMEVALTYPASIGTHL